MIANLLNKFKNERIVRSMMPIGGWYFRKSSRMITCEEFNGFIFDYTEGLLSDKQRILFERHMKVCPVCRNFLKTYVAGYKAGNASLPYSDLDVPKAVPQDLLDAIIDVSDASLE